MRHWDATKTAYFQLKNVIFNTNSILIETQNLGAKHEKKAAPIMRLFFGKCRPGDGQFPPLQLKYRFFRPLKPKPYRHLEIDGVKERIRMEPLLKIKLYDIAWIFNFRRFSIDIHMNYTTNAIGFHFEIGKEYIALQGNEGISRADPDTRRWEKCRTTNMTSRSYSKGMFT